MLGTEVEIRAGDPSLAGHARAIAVRAESEMSVTRRVEMELSERDGVVKVHQDGGLVYQDHDIASVLLEIESMVSAYAAQATGGCARVHAGCVTLGGRRLLVAGPKGCGKTSLLLKLLVGGADVHGDENVLVRGEATIPVPRKFHLRDGTLDLIEELRAVTTHLRRYRPPSAAPLRFFDPTVLGRRWTATAAPAAAVVFLEPAFGSRSVVEPCSSVDMVQQLLFQTLNLSEEAGAQIEDLSRLVRGCACFRLRNGDLDSAAAAIRAVAEGL